MMEATSLIVFRTMKMASGSSVMQFFHCSHKSLSAGRFCTHWFSWYCFVHSAMPLSRAACAARFAVDISACTALYPFHPTSMNDPTSIRCSESRISLCACSEKSGFSVMVRDMLLSQPTSFFGFLLSRDLGLGPSVALSSELSSEPFQSRRPRVLAMSLSWTRLFRLRTKSTAEWSLAGRGISPLPGTCRRECRLFLPYLRDLFTRDGVMVAILRSAIRSSSGVSGGQSEGSVSAGLLSTSDSARSSKGLRGVVKAGLRNGVAAWFPGILGVKSAGGAELCCLVGVARGGGFEKGFCACVCGFKSEDVKTDPWLVARAGDGRSFGRTDYFAKSFGLAG